MNLYGASACLKGNALAVIMPLSFDENLWQVFMIIMITFMGG